MLYRLLVATVLLFTSGSVLHADGTPPAAGEGYEWRPTDTDPKYLGLFHNGVQIGGYDTRTGVFRDYDPEKDHWGPPRQPPRSFGKDRDGAAESPARPIPNFGYTSRSNPGEVPVLVWFLKEKQLTADVLRDGDEIRSGNGRKVDRKDFAKAAEEKPMPILVTTFGVDIDPSLREILSPDTYVVILNRNARPEPLAEEKKFGMPPQFGSATRTATLDRSAVFVFPVCVEHTARKKIAVPPTEDGEREYIYERVRVPGVIGVTQYVPEDVKVKRIDGKDVPAKDVIKQAKERPFPFLSPTGSDPIDPFWLKMFRPETYIVSLQTGGKGSK